MQYPGKAPPPFVETHRLGPEALSRHPDPVVLDAAALAALRALRERPPSRDRVRFTLALAAALVLHLFLIVVVSYELQPRVRVGSVAANDPDDVLEVRFIEPAPPASAVNAPPPPPLAEPPPRVRSPEATRPEPPVPKKRPKDETPQQQPATVAAPEPAPRVSPTSPSAAAPQPVLFGADGSIAMPTKGPGSARSDYTPPRPEDNTGIMSHKTTIKVVNTRFEKDWAPQDENVLSKGMRRAIETTTVKQTVDLGHGVRVKCATVFFVLPVGCSGEDPSAAAKKDGDARLSMPATPLAKDLPDQPPAPTEARCIAAYRKDERVLQGCPTDTPLKAMDAENAERTRRTGH